VTDVQKPKTAPTTGAEAAKAPATGSEATNRVGLTRAQYDGAKTTLCPGCGHNAITAGIIQAAFEASLEPHRVAKLSGIGCSSKTPAYFIGSSHGFNAVHGRMPSIATTRPGRSTHAWSWYSAPGISCPRSPWAKAAARPASPEKVCSTHDAGTTCAPPKPRPPLTIG
jgi:hypothetical protein